MYALWATPFGKEKPHPRQVKYHLDVWAPVSSDLLGLLRIHRTKRNRVQVCAEDNAEATMKILNFFGVVAGIVFIASLFAYYHITDRINYNG
jgi:hypothetical protein